MTGRYVVQRNVRMAAEEAALLVKVAEARHVDISTIVRVLIHEEAERLGITPPTIAPVSPSPQSA